jgi:hypothetical protein
MYIILRQIFFLADHCIFQIDASRSSCAITNEITQHQQQQHDYIHALDQLEQISLIADSRWLFEYQFTCNYCYIGLRWICEPMQRSAIWQRIRER